MRTTSASHCARAGTRDGSTDAGVIEAQLAHSTGAEQVAAIEDHGVAKQPPYAIEVGHESFACPEFVEIARKANVAIVWCEQESRTPIADRTADFAYLRCKTLLADQPKGYSPQDIGRIANLCHVWAAGEAPGGLPYAGDPVDSRGPGGDVFAFMINGAKERAPAAALALAEKLNEDR